MPPVSPGAEMDDVCGGEGEKPGTDQRVQGLLVMTPNRRACRPLSPPAVRHGRLASRQGPGVVAWRVATCSPDDLSRKRRENGQVRQSAGDLGSCRNTVPQWPKNLQIGEPRRCDAWERGWVVTWPSSFVNVVAAGSFDQESTNMQNGRQTCDLQAKERPKIVRERH